MTDPRPVDLATLVADALADITDLVVWRELRPAPVRGDPVLLERMTANLLGNAVRHNHPGGRIAVSTGTSATASAPTAARDSACRSWVPW